MDFTAVILFLTLSYIRPHEWISFARDLRLAAFSLVFAIFATLFRERKFEAKDMFKTPHDYLMVLYFAWIVLAGSSIIDTWKQVYAYLLYYLITVQALSNLQRLQRFLNWWAVMIIIVSGLAVLSEYGLDFMGSGDITHGVMKDRLVLNLSIFNNPNALGHSLVPVVVMLYFICIWKRPVFSRIFAIPLLALPLYALFLTLSKGAFLSMFAGLLMVFTFGRHKVTQVIIIGLACTIGWGAVHLLPRMNELDKTQKDGAIQGRVAAFRFGLQTLKSEPRGLGFTKFQQEFEKVHHYSKAPHSSYVEIGAEFGHTGLIIFLAILYCGARTLITCKTHTVEEERIRRILFCVLITYIVSSWMVDFAFRAAFFMMMGAVGAFHRHLLGLNQLVEPILPMRPASDPAPAREIKRWEPIFPLPASATVIGAYPMTQTVAAQPIPTVVSVTAIPAEPFEPGIKWNQINLLDVAIIFVWNLVWLRIWNYIILHV